VAGRLLLGMFLSIRYSLSCDYSSSNSEFLAPICVVKSGKGKNNDEWILIKRVSGVLGSSLTVSLFYRFFFLFPFIFFGPSLIERIKIVIGIIKSQPKKLLPVSNFIGIPESIEFLKLSGSLLLH